uniref:CDC42 effector protein (Rho GTPase binding) 1b n=1 Tax=Nothobranchius kuhntae TaxID=321403 RepID=A0A1A8I566_NOTKU
MPLHKSSRGSRLDPTMISAPLGDFRHTMHIGRGGDVFGDTSFLSTVGPSPTTSGPSPTTSETSGSGVIPAAEPVVSVNNGGFRAESPVENELQSSDSMSSLTMDLDLDLDLGPSMLGDVLGVMDGLSLDSDKENVFGPQSDAFTVETKQGRRVTERSLNVQREMNEKNLDANQVEGSRTPDENGFKPAGFRPKVRFSDKREEIIRQASEEEEGQTFDFQGDQQLVCDSPPKGESDWRKGESEFTDHRADLPPSPSSSDSSEYEGVTPLDRRRSESCHLETDSDEGDEETGRGYTFEDEFDDEIVV